MTIIPFLRPYLIQAAFGGCGGERVRFRRSLRIFHPLTRSQVAGKIKINQGIIATIVVIRDAVLSARIEPDSRKAFQTCANPPPLSLALSTWNEISTAIFSVSFANIFRCAVSLSNSD